MKIGVFLVLIVLSLLVSLAYSDFSGELPAGSGPEGTVPVQITSDPDGAVVYIDGAKQNAKTNAYFYVTPGNHQVKISKDGYNSFNEEMTLPDETVFVRLKEATDGKIIINVHPDDNYPTVVYIDGIQIGHAPISKYYPVGEHSIRLEKEFYNNLTDTVNLNRDELVLNYTLKANSGMVSIQSYPPGKIFIDEEKQDVTLNPGNIVLEIGKHKVRAHKEGYEDQTKEVTITGGDVHYLNFILNGPGGYSEPKSPGEIWVGITSVPEGATVTINSFKRDEKTPGVYNLRPGNNQVRLDLSGYQIYDEEIAFPEESPLTAPLVRAPTDHPDPSPPSPEGSGKLKITVDPEEAVVRIDGSKSDISHPIQLDAGEYTVSANLEGYSSYEETIKINRDQTKNLNIVLEPSGRDSQEGEVILFDPTDDSVRIQINSTPNGAEIYLNNNKLIGKTPYYRDVSPKTYTFTLKKSGFPPTTKVVDLSDGIEKYYLVDMEGGIWLEGGLL